MMALTAQPEVTASQPTPWAWLERFLARWRCGSTTRQLARGSMATLLARGLGVFAGLAWQGAFARWLGASAYGDFAFALSCLAILALIGRLGGDISTLRFLPEYVVRQQWSELAAFRRWRDSRSLLLCGVLAACGFAALAICGSNHSRLAWTFGCMLVALMPTVLLELRCADLRAAKWTGWSDLPAFIVRPLLGLALGAIAVWGFGGTLNAPIAVGIYAFASVLALVFVGRLNARCVPITVTPQASVAERSRWRGVSGSLLLIASFHLAFTQADILLLGWLCDTRTAGIYGMAVRMAALVSFGLVAMAGIFAPLWSELYASGERRAMQRLVSIAGLALVACTLPAALILVLFGKPLLGLFGPDFVAGYPALVLLCVGQLANAFAGPVCHLLSLSGQQRTVAIVLGAFAVVQVALGIWLIPIYSMWGAAIATTVASVGWNLTLAIIVRRRLGIDSTIGSTLQLRSTYVHA